MPPTKYILLIGLPDELKRQLEKALSNAHFNAINCNDINEIENALRVHHTHVTTFFVHTEFKQERLLSKLITGFALQHIPRLLLCRNETESARLYTYFRLGFSDYITLDSEFDDIINFIKEYANKKMVSYPRNVNLAVVEDDAMQRDALKMLINAHDTGFNITTFDSGEQLLKDERRFDIYLIDILLSALSGIQTIKKLRSQGCDALIFAMSGLDNPAVADHAVSAGANDFLPKPISNKVLLWRLRKHPAVIEYFGNAEQDMPDGASNVNAQIMD